MQRLFGGYLAFAKTDLSRLVNQQMQKIDSISVWGCKFLGFDEPMGIFIATMDTFDNINPMRVNYQRRRPDHYLLEKWGVSTKIGRYARHPLLHSERA